MISYVLAFVVMFVFIFLKAVQQIQVIRKEYKWILSVSTGMGLCEVSMVLLVVRTDSLLMGICTGVAGGLGCLLAMRMKK
jgi:hypothetical protein